MNVLADLLEAQLDKALQENDSQKLSSLLERIFVEFNDYETEENCADVVLKLFREENQEERLCSWLLDKLDHLDHCPQMGPSRKARKQLRLAHGVFDLAGVMTYSDEATKNKVLSSLEKIWHRHEDWRKYAGIIESHFQMSGWVDPAATAEQSLLLHQDKTPREIKLQAQAVFLLKGEDYPASMRDASFYQFLCYLTQKFSPSENTEIRREKYAEATGFVFAKIVASWFRQNPFLLDYCCHRLKELSGEKWPDLAWRLLHHSRDLLDSAEEKKIKKLLDDPPTPGAGSVSQLAQDFQKRTPLKIFDIIKVAS